MEAVVDIAKELTSVAEYGGKPTVENINSPTTEGGEVVLAEEETNSVVDQSAKPDSAVHKSTLVADQGGHSAVHKRTLVDVQKISSLPVHGGGPESPDSTVHEIT